MRHLKGPRRLHTQIIFNQFNPTPPLHQGPGVPDNNRGTQMLFALLIVLAIAFVLTQPAPCTRKRSVSHATSNRYAGMRIQVRWRICTGVGYAR